MLGTTLHAQDSSGALHSVYTMYVYTHIYMPICICIYVYMYIYIYKSVYIYIYIMYVRYYAPCTRTQVGHYTPYILCICAHSCTVVSVYVMHICTMYVYTHIYIHIYIFMYIYIYIYIRVYIYT